MAYKATKPVLKKQKSRQFMPLLIGLLIIVVVAGISGYFVHRHHNQQVVTAAKASDVTPTRPVNSIDYSPGTSADNSASNQQKTSSTPTPTPTPVTSKDGSDGSSSSTATNNAPIGITITHASNNNDSSSPAVIVGSEVSGTTTGTCTFTASQAGQSNVTATNSVTLQVNTYVCPNFIIPYSQFPVGGTWSVKVTLSSNGQQASDSSSVSVEK